MVYVHPEAQAFVDSQESGPPIETLAPELVRKAQHAGLSKRGVPAEMASVQDIEIAGVLVRVYEPFNEETSASQAESATVRPAFVYFHGGGWVIGDLDSVDSTVRAIAEVSGIMCVSVDYRRAPENPFPAALDDCLAVVDAMLTGDSGLSVHLGKVAIGGDSAGGNLAAVLAQQRREQIAHQVLIYPLMDVSSFDTTSHEKYAAGYGNTRGELSYFYDAYAADSDREDVWLSPGLNTDLKGLPPATVITAECDGLVDEANDYARRMIEAGNQVSVIEFKGQVHGFVHMGAIIQDANVAHRLIGTELKAALASH